MANTKDHIITSFLFLPIFIVAQICEPVYTVPKFIQTNSMNGEMTDGQAYTANITVGQSACLNVVTNYTDNSAALGFWANYLTEPLSPVLRASDGDFQDMVLVEWDIQDDLTGPPVDVEEVTLMRNDFMLTTLPLNQTQYLDFNVFPGTNYTYEAVVSNSLGSSSGGEDAGFLNPNGIITGQILTQSGNPVQNTKITLQPNLGRSIKFEGNGYLYWFDKDLNTNRQFDGLDGDYTIETWFRSVSENEQTMFAAVDSGSTDNFITIGLTDGGLVSWTHGDVSIISIEQYAGPGQPWHHLAVVFSSGAMTMYLNGAIVGEGSGSYINDKAEIVMGKNGPNDHNNYYSGYLDDFRIWDHPVEWDDIRKNNDLTLSGDEEHLVAYWKMDEVEGDNVFDLSENRAHGSVCNIIRSDVFAPVYVGALSDSGGNYAIKSIYYGNGTVFTATPSQATTIGRSMEFDGTDDHVNFQLERIDLRNGFTIEGWFKSMSGNDMTLFFAEDPASAEDDEDAQIRFQLHNGIPTLYYFNSSVVGQSSVNDDLWHHWAATLDLPDTTSDDSPTLSLYIDGDLEIESTVFGNERIEELSRPGFASNGYSGMFFEGSLDEFRVWSGPRNLDQISGTMNTPLAGDENGLLNYWNFNEGAGTQVNDLGGSFVTGTVQGMIEDEESWTMDIPLEETFEHYYEPESRQATLNYSNTSVDLVNFTDKSLIPVSGYVRYENTACFIQGAQILVDGESLIPPVLTDQDGKFIVDMEPGSAGKILTVDFNEHEFLPPMIELPLITTPITALYFDDKTKREAEGVVAGGSCEYALPLNEGEHIVVTLAAVNGCCEFDATADEYGNWIAQDLPPIIYNVSASHPDPDISWEADTLTLADTDRTRDFIYFSPLLVKFVENSTTIAPGTVSDGLSDLVCEIPDLANADAIIQQRHFYNVDFEVFELYGDQKCHISSFDVDIDDMITDSTYTGTVSLDEGEDPPPYLFTAKMVNLLSGGDNPYQRRIQMTVEDTSGRTATDTYWAFIIGDEQIPDNNFSTATSVEPWYVLRVPPGDGSFTSLNSEQEVCKTTTISSSTGSAEEFSETAHLGVTYTTSLGLGAEVELEAAIIADVTAQINWSSTATGVNETTDCITVSETYTTSGDGLITGDDGTVFIGGGKTMTVGIAQFISVDEEQCEIKLDTVLTIDDFDLTSVYVHSKYYIENVLIPDLIMIIATGDPVEDADAISSAQDGLDYWRDLMTKDSIAISDAQAETIWDFGNEENVTSISFDAGASYEYSYATGKNFSNTSEIAFENATTIFGALGATINDFGLEYGYSNSQNTESSESTTNEESTGETMGFVLDDDDPGDGFSMTVKRDPLWGMPVFVVNGGQSSCPWEAGTVKRQLASLTATESLIEDVPPDEPAVFSLLLGNSSQTGEVQAYTLSVLSETNPHGAVVLASGDNLAGGVTYEIEPGTQVEVSVSIYRGPQEYDYDDITLQFAPPCEDDIAGAIGSGTEPQNSAFAGLSVHFQKPCSESNIFSPEQGWLVTSDHDDGDTLVVTINDYDINNDDLESVDLQYRAAGVGPWYNAVSIDKDSLTSLTSAYVLVRWNISPNIVPDGEYDLRSVAKCIGDAPDGVSATVTGLIDRNAPVVFGLPEPVDGILGPDDLIRVTFDEYIACEEISVGNGDILFVNTVTGNPVDFTHTCGENMVTIEPNVSNHYIENQTFRATIGALSDLFGNSISEPIVWEFFVNRNPIEWVGTNVSNIVIYVEEEYSTTRQLMNNGGSNRSWYMHGGRDISATAPEYPGNTLDLPSWLNYSPNEGTLTPGSSQDVSIALNEGLNFGEYQATMFAGVNGLGDEPMIIDIRKICHEPEWDINPSDYQYSMNITGLLRTRPSPVVIDTSSDVYDMVGVFVGEELRGVGTLEYLPELETISNFHPYEVFLTIYSNLSSGEELSFQVWDASACAMLGQIEESYSFNANDIIGSLTNPVNITATTEVLSVDIFPAGWTWLSINTTRTDMSINTVLSTLSPSAEDIIKSQTDFAQYSTVTNMWIGALDTIDHRSTYLLKLGGQDTLSTVGYPIDTELDTIPINEGWTWIGYTPQESHEINLALASLDTVVITGDLLKSQTTYAQYLENFGWYGSMDYMDPGEGYFIRSSNDGVLLYPFSVPQNTAVESSDEPSVRDVADNAPDWEVNPSDFYGTMNVTGELIVLDELSDNPLDLVGAFVDGECRGSGQPIYVEPLEKYIVFLTIYGNENESSEIQFHVYSEEHDEVLYAPGTLIFQLNDIIGSLEEPYVWDARYLEAGDPGFIPGVFSLSQNYPNPFNPVTIISFGIPRASDVTITIYDILGKKVSMVVNQSMEPGSYIKAWDSKNEFGDPVAAGIYFYQIRAGEFTKTRKMILLK